MFSRFVRGFSGFALFLFLGLVKGPTQNIPERVRASPQKWDPPGLETPLFTFSQSCLSGVCLGGPLDRLNAILSLLHPLDRYRAPSAIGGAIGRPYLAPISLPRAGKSSQPPRSKPLSGLNRAMVSKTL